MSAQILFFTVLYGIGIGWGMLVRGRLPLTFFYVSGLLWGLLTWVLLALTFISLGIPFTAVTMSYALGAVGIVLTGAIVIRGVKRADLGGIGSAITIFMAVACALSFWNRSIGSYDSFTIIDLGRIIAFEKGLALDYQGQLASWGIFLPLVHAASVFLHIDYLSILQPLFFISLVATFFYLAIRSLRLLACPAPWRSLVPGAAVLAFFTSYFILFQAFYIHNSMPSAVYLFLFFITAWLSIIEKNTAWLACAVGALVGFTLQRTEHPIMASIFLGILLSSRHFSYRIKVAVVGVYAAIILAWYLKLLLIIGNGSDILSPEKLVLMVAALIGLCVLIPLEKTRFGARVVAVLPAIILTTVTAAVILFLVMHQKHMYQSFIALVHNMFFGSGRWGAVWFFITALFIGSFFLDAIVDAWFFTYSIASFAIMLFALSYLRGAMPYRTGFGDSANRIMTHIFPVIVFYLVVTYAPRLRAVATDLRGRLRSAAPLGTLVIIPLVVMTQEFVIHPIDYAYHARVVAGPLFCVPPQHAQRHDFSIALRGVADDQYVASAGAGPAEVVLDMRRQITARVLEMVEYDPAESFTDYGWYVSSDGKEWREVFDTRSATAAVYRVDTVTLHYPLAQVGTFRYLRLVFRSSHGQNRLLLRKVSIYKKETGKLVAL